MLIIYSGLYALSLNTYLKQEKMAKIRNLYNQVPHLGPKYNLLLSRLKEQHQLDYSLAFLLHKNDIYEAQPVGFVNCYLFCRKRMDWLPFSPEIEMFPLILSLLLANPLSFLLKNVLLFVCME